VLTFEPALDNDWLERFKIHKGWSPESYLLANPGDIIVAEQLSCYPKAHKKFPNWHKEGLTYTKLAFEQSSGEVAANYKAGIIKGNTIWDVTGGLGIDSYAFSLQAKQVNYCEISDQPYLLAKNNHFIWGATNIKHHKISAEDAIKMVRESDWVFIDPSRRKSAGRTFLLKDCDPNVLELIPEIQKKGANILLKLSPLYDLNQLQIEIPNINDLYVVSVDGEVKEILAKICDEPKGLIHSICLPEQFEITRSFDERTTSSEIKTTNQPSAFIHVADAAIIKAENIHKIHEMYSVCYWGKSIYLTSDTTQIPGCRSYKVLDTLEYKPKKLKSYLKEKKVNIHKRNFPIEVSQLYKILGVKMGDENHLFFTTGASGERMVCVTLPA
jgi:hypothetical protein